MEADTSPVDVLGDLPPSHWDALARGVRRAVDQLVTAQVPVGLRPFSRWHPDALRDAAPARRAVAEALVTDARFREEVAAAVAGAEARGAAMGTDPLALRGRVGDTRAVALLAVTGQWTALATLAAVLAEERAAAGQAAAETAPGVEDGTSREEARALRRQVQEAQRREDELRRLIQHLVAERDAARAAVADLEEQRRAAVEDRDRAFVEHRERLARLRRRLRLAERASAAGAARQAEIIDELTALAARLRAAPSTMAAPDRSRPAPAAAGGDPPTPVLPWRVGPASSGRPARLPPGVDPEGATAVVALLQVPGLRLLVDGYNVTRDARGVPAAGLEQQRAWLVRIAGAVIARFDVRPTLVFDGQGDVNGVTPRARGVIVRFTSGDETADEALVALVDALPADQPALVVSSDREVRDAVMIRGANSAPARAFLEAVGP